MMLFFKGVLGGLIGACIVYMLIVGLKVSKSVGFVNVIAVLRTPWVIVLLTIAFGIGLWLTLHFAGPKTTSLAR
jgi:hypothetical protein